MDLASTAPDAGVAGNDPIGAVDAGGRFNAVLRAAAPRFASDLATRAQRLGLAVTKADGSTTPIPVAATVVVVDEDTLGRHRRTAALLSSATVKMARAAIDSAELREAVLGGLSPLERTLARSTFKQLNTLATTRVDFIGDGDARRALEVNATIPAMQGYSDIAARAFFEAVGAHVGASSAVIGDWQRRNGSNAQALIEALRAGFRRFRPGQVPRRTAILCRRQDAQLTELVYLRDQMRDAGLDADVAYPDQVRDDDGDGVIGVDDVDYDLVYRHLFVRRLEEAGLPGADVVTRLLSAPNGRRAVILNPPASQVEVKAVFALLSEATDDDALAAAAGLTDDELHEIRASVPWTRRFRGADVVARVANDPARFVLKRAWDYGGRAVFVGRDAGTDAFNARVQAAWPGGLSSSSSSSESSGRSWAEVCALAAKDSAGGGFVVQEAIDVRPAPHVLCSSAGAVDTDLYVDFSVYASVGLDSQPTWGGVCRGSVSSIVNIMGGGGVVPVVRADVAAEMTAALSRSG